MITAWKPCSKCGAMTRHDDGLCYRDTRHPRALAYARIGQFTHTPETPSLLARLEARRAS